MASRDADSPVFQGIDPSRRAGLNSSFSIRSILNLPEENREEGTVSSHAALPRTSSPASPLLTVPRIQGLHSSQHYGNTSSSYNSLLNVDALGVAHYLHPWGHTDVFKTLGRFPLGINIFQKNQRRTSRKRKQRPLFSPHQIQTMEEEFAKQRYVTQDKRAKLAKEVNLTDTQVKTWFQNRRTKWKKENNPRDEGNASFEQFMAGARRVWQIAKARPRYWETRVIYPFGPVRSISPS